MTEHYRPRVRYVIGPDGSPLTIADLPPADTKRWVIRRKAEVVAAVRKIVEVWIDGAKKYERMGEFIARIGWPKFFKMSGLEFRKEHIDDFKHAGLTFKRSTHLTF